MFIIKYKKIFLSISLFIVLFSLGLIIFLGLPKGIDFKGGAFTEVVYENGRPQLADINTAIKTLDLGETIVQESGEKSLIVKTRDLTEVEHSSLLATLTLDEKSTDLMVLDL